MQGEPTAPFTLPHNHPPYSTKRRKMARSSVHHFVDVDADSINQRMLEDVGVTAEGGESDSEYESDDEPEAIVDVVLLGILGMETGILSNPCSLLGTFSNPL